MFGSTRGAVTAGLALSAGTLGAVAACGSDHPGCPPCRAHASRINVNVSVASCPTILSYALLPDAVNVGGSVQLAAYAESPGMGAVVYSWTASGGRVDSASSANTSLTCTAPGTLSVTLKASDPSGACSDTVSGAVVCLAASGDVDASATSAGEAGDVGAVGDVGEAGDVGDPGEGGDSGDASD